MENKNPPPINACVGKARINFGKWYTPNGTERGKITYCEWCLNNGCTTLDQVYDIGEVTRCNCDCPNQESHPQIGRVACAKHLEGGLMTCDIGKCKKCGHWTSSGCIDYCNGCSFTYQICYVCGQK
jgi:hypothetical protein